MQINPQISDKSFTRRTNIKSGKDTVTIRMGGFYVTDKDEIISTMLGSCIAVCARDRIAKVGGMNHFMLPTYSVTENRHWENTSVDAATRYGSFAMEYLINTILSKGGRKNNLEFKVFGGCDILGSLTSIGPRNVSFIKEYMDTEGYGIAAESLGGSHPIVLNYYLKSGRAKIKRLDEKAYDIASSEKSYMHELEVNEIEGDIELFE